MVFSQDRGGEGLADKVVSSLPVADDLGRRYRLRPEGWQSGPLRTGPPGRRFEGDVLAEPETAAGQFELDAAPSWLEFTVDASPPVRVKRRGRAGGQL
jgi:hypothetical protein